MRALKNTTLKPYNFPFQIFSITKNNKVKTHLVCPECQGRIQYKKVCPTHGEVTPIKMTPEGVIVSEKELKEIKGHMKNFEVVGQTHLQSIPLYQLGKCYLIKTNFLPFISLLLTLRKQNRTLIVKGTIRNGIKHFLIYAKDKYAFLQELVESNALQLEGCLPEEQKKFPKDKVAAVNLPEAVPIRQLKAYNPQEKLKEVLGL